MADNTTPKVPVEKLKKLVATWRDLHGKASDVLDEIDALLGGGIGIGAKMRQLEIAWLTVWSSRYHGEYLFTPTKDRPQEKRLLKVFSPEELQVRMLNYIRNDDPFFVRNRHAFSLFVASVNQHGTPAAAPEVVAGCKHVPPCRTDAEHTRKRSAELRA